MPTVKDLEILLASMDPRLEEGEFVFACLPAGQSWMMPEAVEGCFRETEGVTWIVRREEAERRGLAAAFRCRKITLNVASDLEAVGFLARVATELAARQISVNAVSAYHHDHLFVAAQQAGEAMEVLRGLQVSLQETRARKERPGGPASSAGE